MKPAGTVIGAVYAEQVDTTFRQMPIALAVNLINAALTAIVLAPYALRPVPLPWFAAVTLVTAGRLVLWLWYRRTSIGPENAQHWSRLAVAGSLLSGLTWGIGGAFLFPVVPVLGKIFLTMVIGGMCAGAAVLSAAHLQTLLAFLLSAALPMAARFFAEGTTFDSALGTMIVVFAAALGLAGKQFSQTFAETMRLRFERDEANLRLRAEIAEHQATEAALRQAQKLEAIGQLTGGIAHDFNNLMTVVVGNLALASKRTDEASAIAPFLRAAIHAADRGVSLIHRLLAFARKQTLDPRPLDLGDLLFGMKELLDRTLGPEVHLSILVDPDLAPAQVDANQVELAILNLVINARDAMPNGGALQIAIKNRRADDDGPPGLPLGSYVVVSINDDGTGMDEATRARAFDPFFTTKEAGSGSGLGLPMVQGFAVQSGGAVRIRSKLGEGTTVDLWLPMAKGSPADEQLEPPEPQLDRANGSVLLCDDDDDVRHLLADILKSAGYIVHDASAGEEAIRLLDNMPDVDILIADFAMSGINGLETIRQARLRRPDLRSLLITGHAGISSADIVGIPLLRKPFVPSELARRIAEILTTT